MFALRPQVDTTGRVTRALPQVSEPVLESTTKGGREMTLGLRETRPDELDEINAFRAGFRFGVDHGIVSPKEAEVILRDMNPNTPISSSVLDCFCNGAEDGRKNDQFRYLLSYLVAP
jgi:hypothetical protein